MALTIGPGEKRTQKGRFTMARFPNPGPFGFARPEPMQYESRVDSVTVAQFFNAVYAWMAAGLGVTALVAWWVSTRPDLALMFRGPLGVRLSPCHLGLAF